jgi:hypothetical protein
MRIKREWNAPFAGDDSEQLDDDSAVSIAAHLCTAVEDKTGQHDVSHLGDDRLVWIRRHMEDDVLAGTGEWPAAAWVEDNMVHCDVVVTLQRKPFANPRHGFQDMEDSLVDWAGRS